MKNRGLLRPAQCFRGMKCDSTEALKVGTPGYANVVCMNINHCIKLTTGNFAFIYMELVNNTV